MEERIITTDINDKKTKSKNRIINNHQARYTIGFLITIQAINKIKV